jgi:uncharacterized protein
MNKNNLSPVKPSERYVILDALRGFALIGIILANYPEFSLYTFQPDEAAAAMPTAGIDRAVKFLQYVFVDGKFYTLFSLLFGIGFSIIISHAQAKGVAGFRLFYRRMAVLMLIGFVHLMFIWSGDILMLYALMGMALPLFRHASDRSLLRWAAFFLLLPVVVDTFCGLSGVSLSAPAVRAQWHYCRMYGITEENFGYWLRDAGTYKEVFQFLVQGALVRVQEFVDGNRYFKVMGLFIIGFYIGRRKLYADLAAHRQLLHRVSHTGFAIGLPLSVVYAYSAVNGHPFGLTGHSLLYLVSVYPLGFAYMAGLCLLFLKSKDSALWRWLAAPGRMALTNYIGQSVIGMLLFYGTGFALGASVGLSITEAIALCVFLFQMLFSRLWLACCQFGPLEWIWRMLNYGKTFRLFK